jgi:hypothetical protein
MSLEEAPKGAFNKARRQSNGNTPKGFPPKCNGWREIKAERVNARSQK